MSKRIIKLTESDLHRIVKNSVNKAINEGIFDIFKKGPSKEELRRERLENYYREAIRKAFLRAAASHKVHNGDPLYVKALQLCIEARDSGILEPWRLEDLYSDYYMEPRTKLLNRNNWLLRNGEKWPKMVDMETLG
jgi:hypothetical protein